MSAREPWKIVRTPVRRRIVLWLPPLALCLAGYGCDTATFRIPTRGMAPTLQPGDGVAVSKSAYRKSGPRRWDIIVFKYPVDTSRHYIKRVVGLPGESIRVRDGDVYINGEIARKPWAVQEALWRKRAGCERAASWTPDDRRHWELTGGKFTVDSQTVSEPQHLTYSREIVAYDQGELSASGRPFSPIPTSDVMIQFLLEPQEMTGTVRVGLDVEPSIGLGDAIDQWAVLLPLDGEDAQAKAFRSGKLVASGACPLAAGRAALVQVCHVDSALIVRVDGREVFRHEHSLAKRVLQWPSLARRARVRIGCEQGHVVFREVGIYVDVYYTDMPDRYAVRSPCEVGEDEFFVLGDNGANSNDSRSWGMVPRSYLVGRAVQIIWPRNRRAPLR